MAAVTSGDPEIEAILDDFAREDRGPYIEHRRQARPSRRDVYRGRTRQTSSFLVDLDEVWDDLYALIHDGD